MRDHPDLFRPAIFAAAYAPVFPVCVGAGKRCNVLGVYACVLVECPIGDEKPTGARGVKDSEENSR